MGSCNPGEPRSLATSRVTWPLGSSRCLQHCSWKHRPWDNGQDGSFWPCPHQCHIVLAVSQWFLLVQAAPREWLQAQESGICLERYFDVLGALCLSLQTVHKDRMVSFCTGMGKQSPVVWHVGMLALPQQTLVIEGLFGGNAAKAQWDFSVFCNGERREGGMLNSNRRWTVLIYNPCEICYLPTPPSAPQLPLSEPGTFWCNI